MGFLKGLDLMLRCLRSGRVFFQTGHFTSNSRWFPQGSGWIFPGPFELPPAARTVVLTTWTKSFEKMSSHHTKPRDITIRVSSLPTPWTSCSIAEHGTSGVEGGTYLQNFQLQKNHQLQNLIPRYEPIKGGSHSFFVANSKPTSKISLGGNGSCLHPWVPFSVRLLILIPVVVTVAWQRNCFRRCRRKGAVEMGYSYTLPKK